MRVSWREMRAVFAALIANLGIAITKFIAFLFTGSASMLAESVHSVADTGNELLLIVGRGRSSRPASEEHPFGYGRERYFYGFVVSVMLFTIGGAFSVYDGIHKIVSPEPVHSPLVALVVHDATFIRPHHAVVVHHPEKGAAQEGTLAQHQRHRRAGYARMFRQIVQGQALGPLGAGRSFHAGFVHPFVTCRQTVITREEALWKMKWC